MAKKKKNGRTTRKKVFRKKSTASNARKKGQRVRKVKAGYVLDKVKKKK